MLIITMALAAVGVVGVTGTAQASIQPALCTGYTACVQAGYTDHGYGASNGTSYWHEFTGDNCTNYAAYMEVLNNFSSQNQYSPGDANNWGSYFSSYSNSTPAVGSIAWWGGTQGDHVAYVEKITYNSNGTVNSIVVSEDNWGGVFDWRVYLASDSANWPSGFLHFRDTDNPSPSAWSGVGNATFLGRSSLTSGMTLHANQYILSDDGRFVLLMQQDGNLALYTASGVMWSTHTSGNPWAYLGVQGDGNVVLYNGNATAVLWTTNPRGITKLALQDDGNLVAYNASNVAVWASNTDVGVGGGTYKGSNVLTAGMTLTRGQYLRSPDKRFFAMVFADGTVGLYAPGGRMTWIAPNTTGSPWDYVGVQGDGNVVIYNGNATAVLWATGQLGIVRLQLQDDGNLVAYNASNVAVWASNTDGHL